ncbi:hypothetical protein BGX34_004806 [Mortierella sp. NVP85]|nr:hypothetical protein BGX34_004806 [Mortierella sp. NVP85]
MTNFSNISRESTTEEAEVLSELHGCLAYCNSSSLEGFSQQKFDELKGVSQKQAKTDKIKAVEEKIDALGDETNKSLDISQEFSNEASKEYEIYRVIG